MVDPEQLRVDGARLGRRRAWVVLAVALVLIVGLVVLRLGTSRAETLPGPTQPTRATSPAPRAWPADLPRGTMFVGANGAVVMIDTASGLTTRTSVDASATTSLTRLDGGMLVWRQGSPKGRRRVDVLGPYAPQGVLRAATAFLPGPEGRVWALTGRRSGRSTWRLVDVDGRATRTVVADGRATSDGAGGLLEVRAHELRPLFPRPGRSWRRGEVIATGPAGYVVRACAASECRFTLHRDGDDADRTLSTAVGSDTSGGTLSPTDQLLAVTETVGGTSTVRVSVVATGEIKDIFAAPKQSTNDAVWLDDRWLALASEDRLVLYDAAGSRVVTPDVPLTGVGPLAWVPA